MELTLQGLPDPKPLAEINNRVSMLLWGQHGGGKTALAASAPGKKLLFNFDPDGMTTLGSRDDVIGVDLSNEGHALASKWNSSDDPIGLGKLLADDSLGIDTVIVDSTTTFSQLALERGISITNGATIERASPGAYGARNALTLRMMSAMLRVTGKYNKHIIFTGHEDVEKDKEGGILAYVTMLGGKLGSAVGLKLSECWHLQDDGKTRKIMVRNGRMRKGLKTRMFSTEKGFEFTSQYDQFGKDAPYGKGSLAEIFSEWKANGFNKIPIP